MIEFALICFAVIIIGGVWTKVATALESSKREDFPQWARVGVHLRVLAGPVEVAEGILSGRQGFNPPEPTLLYATNNWYKPELLQLLRDAHIKRVSVAFSNGFSIESEELQRTLLKEYIAECHKYGIQVEARMSLTNIFCDDMYAREKQSKNWVAKDASGEPLTYGAASFDRAGRTIRYMACLLQPEWRQYLKDRIDLAIDAGVDAIVYDDVFYQCDCPRCQEEFRRWREALMNVENLESDLTAMLSGKLLIVAKEVNQIILSRYQDEIFRWVADGAYLLCLDIDYPRGIMPNFFPYQVQFTDTNAKEITFADVVHPLVGGWRDETFYVESEEEGLLLGSNAISAYGEQWNQLCSSQAGSHLLEASYGNGKIAIAQFHKTFWNDNEMCARMTDNIVQWAAKELDENKNVAVLEGAERIPANVLDWLKDVGLHVELIAGQQAGDIKPFRRLVVQDLMRELTEYSHKQNIILYANYHAGDYARQGQSFFSCSKTQPVISATDGQEPGYVENTTVVQGLNPQTTDDIESHQGGALATNAGLLSYLRGLTDGWKPLIMGYILPHGSRFEKPGEPEAGEPLLLGQFTLRLPDEAQRLSSYSPSFRDKCQLALAECATFHANLSLPVEEQLLSDLFFNKTNEGWQAMRQYNEFFGQYALYYQHTASVSEIAVLMDDEGEQIGLLNILSANRFLFDVILNGQGKKSELNPYWALLALDTKYIDDQTFSAVSDYVNEGGTLITTRNSFLFDQFYRERYNVIRNRLLGDRAPIGSAHEEGEGMVICYPEMPNLEQLVLELENIIGRQVVEIDAPDCVLYNVVWQKTQNHLVLHLVNYSQQLIKDIAVEVDAKIASIKLLSPDDVKKDIESTETYEDGVTRFVVPELLTYNLVLIKLAQN